MGLHHMFWAHRAHFVTVMQATLCAKPHMLLHDLQSTPQAKALPIHNYSSILKPLGARTALLVDLRAEPNGLQKFKRRTNSEGV